MQSDEIRDDGSDENEDFPLLRSSPDSGSYVSLTVDSEPENDDDQVDKEDTEMNNGHETANVNETDMANYSNNRDQTLTNYQYDSETNKNPNIRSNDELNATGSKMDSKYISYPDTVNSFSSNEIEMAMLDNLDQENIEDTFVVNVGLNQSDSSISENPAYCYGNQVEYAPNGGYEFDNFCEHEQLMKSHNLAFDCLNDNQRFSNFLVNENDYRENGMCDGTNGLTGSQLNLLDSPESLNTLKNNCSNETSDSGLQDINCTLDSSTNNLAFQDYDEHMPGDIILAANNCNQTLT